MLIKENNAGGQRQTDSQQPTPESKRKKIPFQASPQLTSMSVRLSVLLEKRSSALND